MGKFLNLDVINEWEDGAEALGFLSKRCDEYAEWLMKTYAGGPVDEEVTFIAHLIWAGGHKKLENWQCYAIWSWLEKMEDRANEMEEVEKDF